MASTHNLALAKRIRKIGNLGFSALKGANEQNPIPKDKRQNPNFNRFDELGFNYRLNEFSSAVALAQLKNSRKLIRLRRLAGNMYSKVVDNFLHYIQKQKININSYSTYYTFAFYIKNSTLKWKTFRQEFIKNGGEPFYAASKLLNQEKVTKKYLIGKCFANCSLSCVKNCCGTPVAKKLQKKLILLTTNQANIRQIKKQADALNKTLNFFFKKIIY
jgi:dTDP-4-amino-4,6-dideoxygalactose transaminase